MDDLRYLRPASVGDAVALLEQYGNRAQLLAGGTDLVIELREGRLAAQVLVGIEGLKELRMTRVEGGRLEIGAGVTFAELARNSFVLDLAPALAEAASLVGSPQVRNRGTLGGNLGTASPAGDTFAPLLVHQAAVSLMSSGGRREVPVAEYLAYRQVTCTERQELIDRVVLPLPPEMEFKSVFVRLGRRNALAISRMNLALLVAFEEDRPVRGRMALGAAGLGPILVEGAEDEIVSGSREKLLHRVAGLAAATVAGSLKGRASAPYKTRAVESLVREALQRCDLIS